MRAWVRRSRRLSVFLVALGGVLAFAGVAAGGVFGAGSGSTSTGSSASSPVSPQPSVVRELPALRSTDSDTYLLSNGTREARVWSHPVNYRDASGHWQTINDELQQASNGSFHPAASPVPISLPSSLSSGQVSVGSGEHKLSFSLAGAGAGTAATAGHGRSYAGVMPGASVAYTAAPQALREVLTLSSASAPSSYTFNLSYGPALHARLEASGGIAFRDSSGETIYTVPAPKLLSASGASRVQDHSVAHYTLGDGGHTLTLSISKSWLAHASLPARIDPEVFFEAPTECTIVSGEYENTSLCDELDVGVEEGTLSAARALLHFNLEAIPRGSQVLTSALELYMNREYYSSSPLAIEAHALTKNFTEEATWKTFNGSEPWSTPGGDYEAPAAGRQQVSPSRFNEWVFFGFSSLVERWVQNPASNHGVLLKAANENVAGEDNFQPSCGKPCFQPTLAILYSPRIGEQEEDMVTGGELTGGAELMVNVADGDLLLESPDVEYDGEGYETTLSRYYNSQGEGYPDTAFGDGWTLSTGDTTELETSSWDRNAYVQEPGGAYQRFDPTPPATESTPFDEVNYQATEEPASEEGEEPEGPKASLSMQTEGTGTLTYTESGAKWLFENWLPTRIEEPEGAGNTITLSYAEAPPHEDVLSKLEDSHGNALTIDRLPTTGEVSAIAGSDGRTWHYAYNEAGELSSYENPEGHKTSYTYQSSRLLHVIEDESGTYVVTYNSAKPTQVTSVRRIVNGTITEAGSEDEITSFEYRSPQSPTCNPETDYGETIVRYQPESEEATETYCYTTTGRITGWSGPEIEEPEYQEEGSEHAEPPPEDACYENPEFADEPDPCGEEAPLPSAEAELEAELEEESESLASPLTTPALSPSASAAAPAAGSSSGVTYGLADDNTLNPCGKECGYFDIFGEQNKQRLTSLKVTTLRRTMPWNLAWEATHEYEGHVNEVAKAEVEELVEWVKDVKALGGGKGRPLISFYPGTCRSPAAGEEYWISPVTSERVPCGEKAEAVNGGKIGGKARVPTKEEYKKAIEAFFANTTLSKVAMFTAWNEPNDGSNPKNNFIEPKGEVAGEYWRALNHICEERKKKGIKPQCLVAAGDFLDFYMEAPFNHPKAKVDRHYFNQYVKGMGGLAPKASYWAWHAYNDGEEAGTELRGHPKERWERFKQFRQEIDKETSKGPSEGKPTIWLTEQGVRFEETFGEGSKLLPAYRNGGIARAIMRYYVDGLRSLVGQTSQIKRFYYYEMRGEPDVTKQEERQKEEVEGRKFFDSGLLYPPAKWKTETSSEKPAARKIYEIYKYKTNK